MSTKAGTMGFSDRPALFTFWTVAVSALAAAALILSAVALNVAGRGDRSVTSVEGSATREAASIGAPLWDDGKLEAMEGRVLAESVRIQRYAPLWDAGKLEAMEGRVLAETVRLQGAAPLWDAGKLEAMEGRVLAG
jgi:diphthamide synthase (EF-2-diphthine--ammonia ligase)